MIYLIECSDKTGTVLLKIGFSDNIEKRFQSYRVSNPLVKFLKTREGDQRLEKLLHSYFREYKYKHYYEWFVYNDEIVEKFETLTVEELKEGISKKEKLDLAYRLKSINTFDKRLRYLSEYMTEHPEDTDSIPEEYREYLALGKEFIESSGFNKHAINRKEERKKLKELILKDQDFISTLREAFKVGETYSKSNIKEILNKISKELGYGDLLILKATDLENLFEIKRVLITNKKTHKRDNAFKILRQKES